MLIKFLPASFYKHLGNGMSLVVLLLTLVFAQALKAAEPLVSKSSDSSLAAYQIKAGDLLSVSVWGEPDLQREVLVLPDQSISYPLVGVLSVRDKSVVQLQQELEQGLQRYVPNASTNVAVLRVLGSKVYVLGKVNRPGEFDLTRELSVLQALSMAGGTATFAEPSKIKVIRRVDGKEQALAFDYSQVAEGKALEQNILLQAGDVVLVP